MKNIFVFTAKQIVRVALLLIAVSILSFVLISVAPIDPLQTNVGQAALGSMTPEQIAKVEEYWGVNTPAVERYAAWFKGVLSGDMGDSLLYRRPVMEVIGEKFANSVIVLVFAWIFSGIIGLVLGITATVITARKSTVIPKTTAAFWRPVILIFI